jgi:uncharacterized protein YyaL (SSP411 family)
LIGCKQNQSSHLDPKSANDLIKETSPYLLQHAYNPVNWKAWNDETLDLAKQENKLMIISIGYSACHWCHVMEEESFENDSIAKVMNENFINIKVDREERPDVDQVYMNAVQLMTGSGGWPLNCITLPDGRPIFGGTYFTKEQWQQILIDISKLYEKTPEKAIAYAENLTQGLQQSNLISLNTTAASFQKEEIKTAINTSKQLFDKSYGGFTGAPKFPMPITLDYLLRYQHQFNDSEIKSYVHNTLTKMAYGGLYDQIGGGFSRYSVDEKWHIPHFEKMLYDNAQLVSLYSKAYLQEKKELYKTIVEETLTFIDAEFTTEEGAFYSSLDADSENLQGESEEGAYYIWSQAEVKELLKDDYTLCEDYYNLNNYGLWENDQYVLIRNQSNADFAKKHKLTHEELALKIKSWKSVLLTARNQHKKPNTDDKILTSWNALMIQGYLDAYRAFGNETYLEKAIQNAQFLVQHQRRSDGGLNRNFKDGKSTINAYLEDYATVIQAMMALYEVTFDEKYLTVAKDLMDYTIDHFFDESSGMFFYTSNTDKNLITRKIDVTDGVIPSSNSIMALNLFQLSHHFSDKSMLKKAKQMLNNLASDIDENPLSYANWLHVMTHFTNPYYEVAIVGENAPSIRKKLQFSYIPNILITGSTKESNLPLLENKFVEDETLIYVCVNGTCKLPQKELSKAIESIKK